MTSFSYYDLQNYLYQLFELCWKIEEKPVIVVAANQKFYFSLQQTVYQIHRYLPDYKLVIYDLGLSPPALNKVITFIFGSMFMV